MKQDMAEEPAPGVVWYEVSLDNKRRVKIAAEAVYIVSSGALAFHREGRMTIAFNTGEWRAMRVAEEVIHDANTS